MIEAAWTKAMIAMRCSVWKPYLMSTVAADTEFMALVREIQAKKKLNPPIAKKTWREAFGTMPDDELSREAARLGEEWRRSEGMVE
ncbi:MAG TPA: hypothetical protein DDZ88_21250 [Verrucomicrobiales bacterium]|nr:hypothetical protein [Verrucomicrobiales bacterium]